MKSLVEHCHNCASPSIFAECEKTRMKAIILWGENYVLENGLQSHFHHKTLHRRKKLHIFCHFIFHVFINQMLQEALALITRWNAAVYYTLFF